MRRPYQESCRTLAERGLIDEPDPPLPVRMPAHDDEGPLGICFFRMHLEDQDLSGLSLPRTFFGRSLVARCTFADTDLSESCLCWNDFEDVDFSRASLAGADLRASNYERCRFDWADLSGADLRACGLHDCSLGGARLDGARLTAEQVARLPLDPSQRARVTVEEAGEEPAGG